MTIAYGYAPCKLLSLVKFLNLPELAFFDPQWGEVIEMISDGSDLSNF